MYTAFKSVDHNALAIIQHSHEIGFSVVVLAELLHGFKLGKREDRNRKELNQFLESPRVSLIDINRDIAERHAFIAAHLRNIGQPIPTNDM